LAQSPGFSDSRHRPAVWAKTAFARLVQPETSATMYADDAKLYGTATPTAVRAWRPDSPKTSNGNNLGNSIHTLSPYTETCQARMWLLRFNPHEANLVARASGPRRGRDRFRLEVQQRGGSRYRARPSDRASLDR